MKKAICILISLFLSLVILAGAFVFLSRTGLLRDFRELYEMASDENGPLAAILQTIKGMISGDGLGGAPDGDGDGDLPPFHPDKPIDEVLEQLLEHACESLEETVDVEALGMSEAQLKEEMERFFFTHPAYFYVSTGYQIRTRADNDVVAQVKLNYLYDKTAIPAMRASYESELDRIVENIPTDGSDFEKILAIHDHLVRMYSYDYRNVPDEERIRDAYRFFTQHTGVCQAYMLATVAICERVGIECIPVTSTEMVHAWNMVLVDGEWFHFDVTWDDAGGESSAVYPSYISYTYFLISSEALVKSGRNVEWKAEHEAVSKRFDNALWHAATTPMTKQDGEFYCAYYDEERGAPVLCHGTAENMEVAEVLEGVRWTVGDRAYKAAWVGLISHGDYLYFSTEKAICRYDTASKEITVVADLTATIGAQRHLYGFSGYDGNKVTYVYAVNYHGSYSQGEYILP